MKRAASTLGVFLGGVLAAASLVVAASCGGGGGGGGVGMPPPQASPTPALPTVHLNFFGTANGVFASATFGNVSGFTQQQHAQVLGLPPGTKVVITNNDTVTHTLNVYSAYPTHGTETTAAMPNGGVFGPGFQTGPLAPGATTAVLTVTSTPSNLYIVCGFHYGSGMQDGAIIKVGASPGPEATPMPTASGACHGYGC